MRALALLALASAAVRSAAAPQPIMFAGPSLGGGVPVEVQGAPLWRLDRAFQRTCVKITCSGSKARSGCGATHAGATTRQLRRSVLTTPAC